ncbi:alpha/beta fold hydrolase [Falsiruegeria mediterranea]|uniref:Pyrethroid hydrolase n=1 Tax=Falsiruegeria mediterranea M17 TaxID=1200281 RepID=A0A2R8C9N9_9RHOB|nr:alpha/beta fold hydrolase [Falsiruegeria mediterranea]SPJ29147.1 Pyrethroid hydrolase [Falsiruegeria mediterranea M17]
MADFLLVHGSCHGAWCWRDLIPALEAQGHAARAIDLPGMGADQTPLAGITLDDCRDAVLAASTPETLLVGHSWGGYPISAAAEAAPDKMRGLIYLCAYFPTDGMSMVDRRKRSPRQTLADAVVKSDDGVSYTIDPSRAPDLFYHDCPPEALSYAMQRLRPQPIAPQDTPLPTTAAFDSVPKSYIRCAQDRTIPPEYQAQMTRDWPVERVHVMESSHSPFLADPSGLAELLTQIERQF